MNNIGENIKENGLAYYIFEYENEFYLYNYGKGFIVKIQENIYNLILDIQTKKTNNKEAIVSLIKENLLSWGDNRAYDARRSDIAYLSFAPVYDCNLRCTYCFAGHGTQYKGKKKNFSEDTLISTLDYFFYKRFPYMKQYRIDFVSGGEPLMGIEIIKKTIDYINTFVERNNKQVSIWLCTNGCLLTDEICEYLDKNNVQIGISIDGEKSIHDKNRIDNYGNGTYDKIIKNVDEILNNDFLTKKFKNIWGLCTATNENCDFLKILYNFQKIGIKNVQIRLVRSKKDYNIECICNEYLKLHNKLYEDFCQGKFDYFFMILNENDQYGKVLKRIILDELLVKRCNAGINKITICPDGTIYPCDSLVGISKYCMGNINEQEMQDSCLKNIDVFKHQVCSNCNAKYLCGGDCYYNSFINKGTEEKIDEKFCVIQKYIIESCIVLKYKMQLYNEINYEKLRKRVEYESEYRKKWG